MDPHLQYLILFRPWIKTTERDGDLLKINITLLGPKNILFLGSKDH